MSELTLKDHYSVSELLKFNLSSLPNAHKNVLEKAKRENWLSRKRTARGGGLEYAVSSLPQEIQDEINRKFAVSVVRSQPKALPVVKHRSLNHLNDKQRAVADARIAVVQYVLELEKGMPRYKAVKFVCSQAKAGLLSEKLTALIGVANAKQGEKRTISDRTLNQWVLDYVKAQNSEERILAFAPAKREATPLECIWWLPEFMVIWRNTNGLNVSEAYDIFCRKWQQVYWDQPLMLERVPSVHQVRATLERFPKHLKELGRKTGAELRALNTYVKRDWSCLKANDVWVGDGHSMKMKVQHPDHGRPFIPEVTLVMDTASRFIVGWSVSLAENALAVADAIRNGVENHGIPAVYYSDNGGGEKNWTLDGDLTGILPRLGINHQTGIPGNPQGRGIIERVNRTLLLRIARQFETYHGDGADRETVRKTSTGVISLEKALRQNKQELTEKQRWAMGKLPSWKDFVAAVQAGIDWYNNEHVHREIGMTPAAKRSQLLKNTELVLISPIEADNLFRPALMRTAQRGWISLFNNDYFHQDLINVDGEKVQVMFDIHDPQFVIVRKQDGSFVCKAELDGNKRDAFPRSFIEKARQDRHKRRLALKMEQVDEINAELNPIISIQHNESAELLHGLTKKQAKQNEDYEWELLPADFKRKVG